MVERFRVEGLRELGEAFRFLSDDMQRKVARATTNAGAQVIKRIAKRKAPIAKEDYVVEGVQVQRGNLPKNIIVKRVRSELTSEHVVTVRGGRKHGYASRVGVFNEFGTVKMRPQAFLRPALDEGKTQAVDAMKKKLKERIDKAWRK